MNNRELAEFSCSTEIIAMFGDTSGLLYQTEPYYPWDWYDSDSAVKWTREELGACTRCECYERRGKREKGKRG